MSSQSIQRAIINKMTIDKFLFQIKEIADFWQSLLYIFYNGQAVIGLCFFHCQIERNLL